MKSENVTRFLIAGLLPYRAGQQPRQCHNDRFSLLERHLDGHRLTRLIQEFETHFRAVIGNVARRQLAAGNFHGPAPLHRRGFTA
jgi:hypothetical protein